MRNLLIFLNIGKIVGSGYKNSIKRKYFNFRCSLTTELRKSAMSGRWLELKKLKSTTQPPID